jgi:hypothetical protein
MKVNSILHDIIFTGEYAPDWYLSHRRPEKPNSIKDGIGDIDRV